ncbi:MAG: NAD(P)/FAD-dependent oxidoreductase [Anaerolineales bacterium]
MPLNHAHTHWLHTAPQFSSPPITVPAHTDVAILGAGIMGCSLAYWLARFGLQPLVFERNPMPAMGATGRNGGLHVSGSANDYVAEIEKYGRDGARELFAATLLNQQLLEEVLARDAIDAYYAIKGFLVLAQADEVQNLRASAEALHADGFPAEWLDRSATVNVFGTALGDAYVGALWKPNDAVIHSARYTLGMAEAAMRHGATFACGTLVTRVEPDTRGWRIHTPRGAVFAPHVIITLNAWAADLFPELRPTLTPVRGHIALTAPVDFSVTPWAANHDFEYGRQVETGQLLVGGMRHARADLELGYAPQPGENAPDVQPEVVAALCDFIPRLMPAAKNVPVVHRWTGVMDFSPDRHPLAGRWPGRDGLWMIVGLSGHGMPYTQVLPQAIAAQVAGVNGPQIPMAFTPSRFLAA